MGRRRDQAATEIQFITTPAGRMAVIPEPEYRRLVEADQDRADLARIDAHRNRVSDGEELVPSAVVDRLLAGDHPVRVWREHRGLRLVELAGKAALSHAYVSQIETGKREGSLSALKAIAEALDVTIDDLVS